MPNPVDLATLSSDLPVFLQNGIGVGYSAIDVRRAVAVGLQEGVVAPGDAKVTQRAGGAGMAVDVAAFEALVKGDTVVGEGMYYVRRASALTGATELTATAADGANPRIDQVILEIKNDVHDGSGLNRGRVRYLAGTATAGATLANRVGAAALPNSAIRLADVLMPAVAANVPTANIVDRRPWARGAEFFVVRSQNAAAGNNYSTTSLTLVDIDATNLAPRIECAGVGVVIVSLLGTFWNANAGAAMFFDLNVDGVDQLQQRQGHSASGSALVPLDAHWYVLLAAGSHVFKPRFRVNGGTGNLGANATETKAVLAVHERIAPSSSN